MKMDAFDRLYVLAKNIGSDTLRFDELLAIRRIFSLVDMITKTKFSNCPIVFKIEVVQL